MRQHLTSSSSPSSVPQAPARPKRPLEPRGPEPAKLLVENGRDFERRRDALRRDEEWLAGDAGGIGVEGLERLEMLLELYRDNLPVCFGKVVHLHAGEEFYCVAQIGWSTDHAFPLVLLLLERALNVKRDHRSHTPAHKWDSDARSLKAELRTQALQ
ncbi:hypothetical protein N0V88_000689 [Collariella sp. IMI 366227]|nr:hypothetical protein N0V88_000689 [Collariella sp. IMI 366227]